MQNNYFLKSGKSISKVLTLVICLFLISCKANETPPEPDPSPSDEIGKAQVWLTKGDKSKLLNKEGDLSIRKTPSTSWPVIVVDTTAGFQIMEGFGAALTGSSAYLFHHKMDAATRMATLRKLFDPVDGIGISFLRLTIGASDFSLSILPMMISPQIRLILPCSISPWPGIRKM
jgi:glucosylceramidase